MMIPRFLNVLALGALLVTAPAYADEKETSGDLETWQVTKDGGDALGTETLRIVKKETGVFASGELNATLGKKKMHRKTHLQRATDGHIEKYQRTEGGVKSPGVKLFSYEGQMRVAPLNTSGKPTPIGKLEAERVWDSDLWHLYALWSLPSECKTKSVSYFDPEKKATGEATITCTGDAKVFDAKKQPVDVHTFKVGGVPNAVELFVSHDGKLVGAKGEGRWMLKAKWGWTAETAGNKVAGDKGGDGDDDDDKVDRGIGE